VAVAAKFPDLAIADPTRVSGSAVVKLCAHCHSPRGREVLPDDPMSVRFQGTTLTWSRCFKESNNALDCTSCHNPHRNVVTSSAYYEAKCLLCHDRAARSDGSTARPHSTSPSGTGERTTCPVNPSGGCISCHMPAVTKVVPHSSFTDHFIRVHRN
jgi:formate-dependent nitrite reductase cytochrome c552 subunit